VFSAWLFVLLLGMEREHFIDDAFESRRCAWVAQHEALQLPRESVRLER